MIKPPDFDPSRRYPVYQFTYAGPGRRRRCATSGAAASTCSTSCSRSTASSSGCSTTAARAARASKSQWPVYGRLGELELQDLEDGVAWLKQQPYVDASRIVLSGWSYGGFMTAYALTHSTSWSAGIVGAPVTDWRDYDTIYTERLMKLPQNNPDGYRRTAPRFAADKLHGRMLLLHGTMDDNVHMQNSVQFAYELQKAGKPFEMMVYPKSRHGIGDPPLEQRTCVSSMFDFVMRTIGGETPRPAARHVARERCSLDRAARRDSGVIAAELRPPRAELDSHARAWTRGSTCTTRSAASRARTCRVFLTDSAVGTQEENNLRHLVDQSRPRRAARSRRAVPHEQALARVLPRRTRSRRGSTGSRRSSCSAATRRVGRPRCVEHAWELRQEIREREPRSGARRLGEPARRRRAAGGLPARRALLAPSST